MDPSEVRITVRLPVDAAAFLEQEARFNFTSKNAQIVGAVRAAMRAKDASLGEARP